MTNEEILKKAIEKAEKNDWLPKIQVRWSDNSNDVIWRHDFAKALWGEEEIVVIIPYEIYDYKGRKHNMLIKMKSYIYHLMKMVKEEEPLKYLERFLD